MNFPILDRLPIPSRQRAHKLAAHFTDELAVALVRASDEHAADDEKARPGFADPDALGPRLLAARDAGILTEKQFRDNLTVSFVASQENPQLLLISMLYLLAKHPVRPTPPAPCLFDPKLTCCRTFKISSSLRSRLPTRRHRQQNY
jgi:cytochrome P450